MKITKGEGGGGGGGERERERERERELLLYYALGKAHWHSLNPAFGSSPTVAFKTVPMSD